MQHCRKLIHSSYREERERLTGEKVAQLLCPDEEEIPSQEEAVRYLSLQGKELQLSKSLTYLFNILCPVVGLVSIGLSYPLTLCQCGTITHRIGKARRGLSKLKSNGKGFLQFSIREIKW
jgi:hypothetical protein